MIATGRFLRWIALGLVSVLVLVGAPAGWAQQATQEVKIEAGDFFFKPSQIEVKTGQPVKITVANTGKIVHELEIKKLGQELGIGELEVADINPGQSKTLEFTPRNPGTYEIVCGLPGHEAAGMKGTLTITGAPVAAVAGAAIAPAAIKGQHELEVALFALKLDDAQKSGTELQEYVDAVTGDAQNRGKAILAAVKAGGTGMAVQHDIHRLLGLHELYKAREALGAGDTAAALKEMDEDLETATGDRKAKDEAIVASIKAGKTRDAVVAIDRLLNLHELSAALDALNAGDTAKARTELGEFLDTVSGYMKEKGQTVLASVEAGKTAEARATLERLTQPVLSAQTTQTTQLPRTGGVSPAVLVVGLAGLGLMLGLSGLALRRRAR